ncbi:hypothetical protein CALCODRAFT_510178 [Calocera cornea HHB12733]|uniref:Uncharacterized protein n=1 Tax=Calocera cornea HHB12733 TaxID=1353952 RepID=A0A165ERM2_9BASI|nr:hypothetical protein CALCODRAFT_510178 [Calocera cornea HHB12733]
MARTNASKSRNVSKPNATKADSTVESTQETPDIMTQSAPANAGASSDLPSTSTTFESTQETPDIMTQSAPANAGASSDLPSTSTTFELAPLPGSNKRVRSPDGAEEERPKKRTTVEPPIQEELLQTVAGVLPSAESQDDEVRTSPMIFASANVIQIIIKEEEEEVLLADGIWGLPDWKARAAAITAESLGKSFVLIDMVKRVQSLEDDMQRLRTENAQLQQELRERKDPKGKGVARR